MKAKRSAEAAAFAAGRVSGLRAAARRCRTLALAQDKVSMSLKDSLAGVGRRELSAEANGMRRAVRGTLEFVAHECERAARAAGKEKR